LNSPRRQASTRRADRLRRATVRCRNAAGPVLAAIGLAGCTVHDEGFDAPLELPPSFGAAGEIATDGPIAPDRWWTTFGDEQLDRLVEIALAGNFDLAIVRDRLDAARAVARRERAPLLPSIDGSAFGERVLRSAGGGGGEAYGAGVVGTYEVDLWRRNASATRGAALEEAVARAELEAAAITLTADVALSWYALIEQRGQARVLDMQIRTNEQVLEVVRARFGGGVVRASDVLRQERLLESTREQRATVASRIEVLEHALLVLIGQSPTTTLEVDADHALPELPPEPTPGLPSDLVRRRPDVRAAYLAIAAADADVAVAVADRSPSVTIRLDAATAEEEIADLFDDWSSVLAIDVIGPIFDGGARAAEVDRARAVKAERVNVYARTVLLSFRQVLDAISREDGRTELIRRIERQLDLAQRTSERLNREYLNGDISYIDVLDALTTEQQLQRDLLSARLARINDRIDLHRALAGGWEGLVPGPAGTRPPGSASEAEPMEGV